VVPRDQKIPAEWEQLPGSLRFKQLLAYQMETHVRKGGDYSGSGRDTLTNLRQAADIGVAPSIGVLVRMSDKWERIKSLVRDKRIDQPFVVDESIFDTLLDLSNYSLLDIIMLEEEADARQFAAANQTDQGPGDYGYADHNADYEEPPGSYFAGRAPRRDDETPAVEAVDASEEEPDPAPSPPTEYAGTAASDGGRAAPRGRVGRGGTQRVSPPEA
jgi:hypothetical protein